MELSVAAQFICAAHYNEGICSGMNMKVVLSGKLGRTITRVVEKPGSLGFRLARDPTGVMMQLRMRSIEGPKERGGDYGEWARRNECSTVDSRSGHRAERVARG